MVKQTIQIFARVKPTKAKVGYYGTADADEESDAASLSFTVPKDLAGGLVNNKRELYKFKFSHVFEQTAKQEDIFDKVARPVADNAIAGYNGTIFAYGQTGSGKTFTITGGAERYTDRGIIPRTLSYLFAQYAKNPEMEHTTHISYLELYNESGYDLLDPKHEVCKLEDLPKVQLMEDANQNIHLKNLSVHTATSEEDALNLLFTGDTNRMIAETPMNQASTRSHCIFTIHLTCRVVGSATITKSKLHLVDLAGSERVSKTGVTGTLLTEAKYINGSLHFLEQVIVALADKHRTHIPYRNSMMTSVLRDSLGGNCKTTMIATCSVEKKNIDESISTCRFAQRVALIKNEALLNEELDPRLLAEKLKREVAQLKEELALATGEQRTDELTEEEIQLCLQRVNSYVNDSDPEASLNLGGDMRKIQRCFRELKRRLAEASSLAEREPTSVQLPAPSIDHAELRKLTDTLQQRDSEINILVNMLKKEKKRAAEAVTRFDNVTNAFSRNPQERTPGKSEHWGSNGALPNKALGPAVSESSHVRSPATHSSVGITPSNRHHGDRTPSDRNHSDRTPSDHNHGAEEQSQKSTPRRQHAASKKMLGNMSVGRQEAFEIYRRDHDDNHSIEEHKAILKQRYAEAKQLGDKVNQSRAKINRVKTQIEKHRVQLAMQGSQDLDMPDEQERQLRVAMEEQKEEYKGHFGRLKVLKTEIEHLQHLLEASKVKLMKDFELWWAGQAAALGPPTATQLSDMNTDPKEAWRTPPHTPGSNAHSLRNPRSQSKDSNGVKPYPTPSHSMNRETNRDSQPRRELPQLKEELPHSIPHTRTFVKESLSEQQLGRGDSPLRDARSLPSNSPAPDRAVSHSDSSSTINLTGDPQADADILAFLKARQKVVGQMQRK